MNNRLLEIIKYKTGGRQTDFAALLGWTPQYLAKLLRGENFGIKPVVTLLEKLPEISGRWLLLGQGDMLEIGELFNLQREAFAQVQAILETKKYIPVMSPEELREYEQAVRNGRTPVFSPETLEKWRERTNAREQEIEARFADAIAKSTKLCNQRTVKK